MAVQSNPTKRFHLKFMFWLLPLLILQAGNVICNNEQDEITDQLPGLTFKLNFKHYSGFLQVSKTRFLHYWFVTSQNNPETDPLVFWFNGGPGCSSMDGLLKEMGPYLVNADGQTLDKNPHAWNRNASIVYIESPAGVGFSYSSDGNFTTDDDQTAEDNYEAVKQFFGKFPSFRQQPLFIAGESYAGIYVPMLTAKLVSGQSKFPVNLKGMVIGNGYVDVNLNVDTSIRFAYAHGLVDEHLWKRKIVGECCSGNVGKCDLAALEGSCGETIEDIFDYLWDGGLNIYDLYRDCDSGTSLKFETMKQGLIPAKIRKTPASADFGKAPPKGLNCLDDSDVTTYMNLKEVRKALHIPKSLPEWTICSRNVSRNYHRTYGKYILSHATFIHSHHFFIANVYGFVKKILRAHVRVLLYYGDTDMACNFLLGQQFSSRVGPRLVAKKEAWTFNGQISGFKTAYANGLTYLTVRGAGHMVPQWRPTQMEYVFNQFLTNQTIGE